ncbi:GtrA family protein [Burkholderia sp. 4701]|nr:GtrA family protein [Burkholderia sp. 4701]MXN82209.1 GtrA family protein [Burkholderia sp. 4812]
MHKDSVSWRHRPELVGRFLRFALVGGLCASLNLSILWLFTSWLGWSYLVGVVFSFFSVNWLGLWLNNRFTFNRESKPRAKEIKRYYATMSGALALNFATMYAMVSVLGIHYLLACILLTLLFTIVNFLTHCIWTFSS